MNIYERIGVQTVINVSGSNTRLGGALMPKEVVAAMSEASHYSLRMDELEAASSRIIAEITGAEAGYVTAGAAAAMTLSTAACMTGLDISRMNQLPDTSGMPDEVLMALNQKTGYAHSWRASGAKIVDVGIPDAKSPPIREHTTKVWEYEAAITDRTVAIAYQFYEGATPPLEDVCAVGKKHNIPVLVDAADEIPPIANLRRFISMGADLVCFSGGKGIRGPQSTGVLCGRRDLIAAVALQHLDMGGLIFETWDPPESLIPKEKLRGLPQQGIGRSMKVSKEEIVGLLTALQLLTEEEFSKDLGRYVHMLRVIVGYVEGVPGVELETGEYTPGGYPILQVKLDKAKLGKTAFQVAVGLKMGVPPILIRERLLPEGVLVFHPINLNEEQASIVGQRLLNTITGR